MNIHTQYIVTGGKCVFNVEAMYLTFPKQDFISYPSVSQGNNLLQQLRRMTQKIGRTLQNASKINHLRNITDQEINILKSMKKKPLIFLPSDKGGEFCVVDQHVYTTAVLSHLSDETTYKRISHMKAKTIEIKINTAWRTIAEEQEFPIRVQKSFITNNSSLPKFYCLIKTHKQTTEIKVRPIVSNINGPTYKVSWLLTKILTPLLNIVPAHLESSEKLIANLQSTSIDTFQEFPFPCSLDVVSLSTHPSQCKMQSTTSLTS